MDGSLNFQNLDIKSPWASLFNISGEISLKDEQIRLLIDSDSEQQKFREWFEELQIGTNCYWLLKPPCKMMTWILKSIHFGVIARTLSSTERLELTTTRICFWMDLTFGVYQAQVNQLYKYWPANKWKPKVLDYLDTFDWWSWKKGWFYIMAWLMNIPSDQNKECFEPAPTWLMPQLNTRKRMACISWL